MSAARRRQAGSPVSAAVPRPGGGGRLTGRCCLRSPSPSRRAPSGEPGLSPRSSSPIPRHRAPQQGVGGAPSGRDSPAAVGCPNPPPAPRRAPSAGTAPGTPPPCAAPPAAARHGRCGGRVPSGAPGPGLAPLPRRAAHRPSLPPRASREEPLGAGERGLAERWPAVVNDLS